MNKIQDNSSHSKYIKLFIGGKEILSVKSLEQQ